MVYFRKSLALKLKYQAPEAEVLVSLNLNILCFLLHWLLHTWMSC